MNWPDGWTPVFAERADHFLRELQREASANHVLFGLSLRAIGTDDADNVLFEFTDGSGRYAAVHLTYRTEADPQWPATAVYDDWGQFEREGFDS